MVIDTTIFVEHLRKKNKLNSELAKLPNNSILFVSSVTVFELLTGATDSEKKFDVEEVLSDVFIIEFDRSVAERAAKIYRNLKGKNLMIEFRDIFIAATALTHNLPIKTLNTKHFNRIDGLELL
jgi:predicted nucleic acid-binding protein